jgi:hypothetical protein
MGRGVEIANCAYSHDRAGRKENVCEVSVESQKVGLK